MTNGNPFYVKPAGAMVDTAPMAKGLGAIAQRAVEQRKLKEMTSLVQQGDPVRIQEYMADNPQLKDEFDQIFEYTNDTTRDIATRSYASALSVLESGRQEDGSYAPESVKQAEEIMQQGAEGVSRFGGRPTFMQQDLERLGEDPERVAKAARTGLLISAPDTYKAMFGDVGKESYSIGAQEMFKDDAGNIFFGAAVGDRRRGTLEGRTAPLIPGTEPVGPLRPAGGAYGETADEKIERSTQEWREKKTEGSRLDLVENYRQKLPAAQNEIRELDNLIASIDSGADTGYFASYFPTMTQATSEAYQAARRLGLNIIQSTTFGALSAGEMKLAMETATPINQLSAPELRKWAIDRKNAMYKLQGEVGNAIDHLNQGGTIEQWTAQRTRVRQAKEQGINVGAKRRNKTSGQVEEWRDDGEWHPVPAQ